MLPANRSLDQAIVNRAAQWMARMWADDVSQADHDAFEQWRAAHPDHDLAYKRLQGLGQDMTAIPSYAVPALLAPVRSAGRRRLLSVLGWSVVAGGSGYVLRDTQTWRHLRADFRTGVGEVRRIELEDGTQIVLDTATAIDVLYDDRHRRVVLHDGEILVHTAPGSASMPTPFIVQGQHGTIRALGTRFTVAQDKRATSVAVFEGEVLLRPLSPGADEARLRPGQAATFSESEVGRIRAAREADASWTQGVLVAEQMRLDAFLHALGRYRPGLLRTDPAVAGWKISGVFPLLDTDRALNNLTLALPLRLSYRTRYWVSVHAREGFL